MVPTFRTEEVRRGMNDQSREHDHMLIEKTSWEVIQHVLKYQEDIKRLYYKHIKHRVFNPKDWVLKKVVH